MKEKDKQVGGDHYDRSEVQPIDLIRACNLDFEEGSVIKYIARYKEKNGLEDLIKARQYLDWIIKGYEETEATVPPKVKAAPKLIPIGHEALTHLLAQLKPLKGRFDCIVIMPRGGLTVGHIIAEMLGIKNVVLYTPDMQLRDENILIAEDIIDSGETMIKALSGPRRLTSGRIVVAALAQRYNSEYGADFVGEIITHDDYVLFDWECVGE